MKNTPISASQNMLQDLETKLAGLPDHFIKKISKRIKDKQQAGVALSPNEHVQILSAFMETLTGVMEDCQPHLQNVSRQLEVA